MGEGWSERVEVEVCNPPQLVVGWKIECPSGLRGNFTPTTWGVMGWKVTHPPQLLLLRGKELEAADEQ